MYLTEGKVINCRAAVLWRVGAPMTIENITVDPPQSGEVRVRMVAAGVCSSDARMITGRSTDFDLITDGNPIVLGHEGTGIVESIGPGVTSVKPYDKVIALWIVECGKCRLCSHPQTNLCESDNFFSVLYHKNRESRMKINGRPLLAYAGTSTFSEYVVIRESQLAKVNPDADLKTICIVGCSVGHGYHSAISIANVHPGAICAVWGLNTIGLSTMLGCKQAGAKHVIGIDIISSKKEIAQKFGCTHFINPRMLIEPIEDFLRRKYSGLDYAFDCIGNQDVLNSAYKALSPWGALIANGIGKKGYTIEAKAIDLFNGRQVLGHFFGNQKPRLTNQNLVEKHINGTLPIDDMITHRTGLHSINDAFDKLKDGKTIKSIIEF